MTDMNDKKLDMMLARHSAPEPSELLKARILKQAKSERPAMAAPANDGDVSGPPAANKRSFAKRYMAMAACALFAAGITITQMNNAAVPSGEYGVAIEEAMSDYGFDDIYAWVESEEI